jgi:hypothetical protein
LQRTLENWKKENLKKEKRVGMCLHSMLVWSVRNTNYFMVSISKNQIGIGFDF